MRDARLMSVLVVILGLSGCMGDGGDGSVPDVPVKSEDTKILSAEKLSEGQSVTVPLRAQSISESADRVVATNSDIDGSLENDRVILKASMVDRPQSAEVLIGDGKGNAIARIDVAVNNDSAEQLENEVEAWVAEGDQLALLSEDKQVHSLMIDQAYITKAISSDTEADLRNGWAPTEQPSYGAVKDALTIMNETLMDYRNGEVGDSELAGPLQTLKEAMEEHGQYALKQFDAVLIEAPETLVPTRGAIGYREEAERVSRYIGNEAIGEQTDAGWVFDEGFEHLELAVDVADLAVCQQEVS